MSLTKVITAVVVILLIIWAVFALKSDSEPTSEEPIKIGAVLSLSGIAVQDGESIKEGLDLAKSHLGEKGVDVEIIYQDDRTEPKDTISAINAVKLQGVEAIIGPTWSFLGDAGVPVADQLGLVSIMPANTSEYVGAKSDYAFFTTVKVEKIVPLLTEWLEDNDKKRVAIVRNTGGAWYEVVGSSVKQAVSNVGGEVVLEETVLFGNEADTLPTIVAKLKNIKADIIFTEIDDDQGLFIMFKKLQEQGNQTDIMSVTTALGRVLNDNSLNLALDNNVYALAPKASEDFQKVFEEVYGKAPGAYADTAYDSLMLLVEAIQKREETPLHEYLRNKTNYKGYSWTYNFDENGDIKGGEWVLNKIN